MKQPSHLFLQQTLFALGVILALGSCSRYYYQPNAINAPMLTDKNDLKIGVNGSFGTEDVNDNPSTSNVLNFHGAYSPVKYLGLMTTFSNYRYDFEKEDKAAGDVDAHATLFEGGLGGYYPIVEKDNGLKLIVDTYVGYGGGKLNSDVKMDFDRMFVQPGINLTFPYFDVGLSARIAGIKYSNFDENGMSQTYIDERGLIDITKDRHFFFEPALTLRGGYKFIKGQMQIVRSESFANLPWRANKGLFTMGISFSLEEFWKRKL